MSTSSPNSVRAGHLRPPETSYVWEEPLLPPRLLVRVGPDFLRGGDLHRGDGGSAPALAVARLQAWGVGRVSSEETGTLSGQIKLIRSCDSCCSLTNNALQSV